MWKIIQVLYEKWWSKNLLSNVKHLSDATQKEKLCYLFIYCPSYIAHFYTSVTTWCQQTPELPHILQRSLGLCGQLLFYPLLCSQNLGNYKFSRCVLKATKCYWVRGLAGWGKKCILKTKREILEVSSGYIIPAISEKSTAFDKSLGGTCSIQLRLWRMHWAPGSGECSIKAKISPGDMRMKNSAGTRTHERMRVTKLMATRTYPSETGGYVGLLHGYFPTAAASRLVYGCFVVMYWEGTDCIPRECGSPAQGRLNRWGLISHQSHYFLKYIKYGQGLSCHWNAYIQHLQTQIPG